MPRGKKSPGRVTPVETFVHTEEQRTNIPTAELETFMRDADRAPTMMTYPRTSELLYPRDPAGDPQLVWRGKDDQDRRPLAVMSPPIYIQEKIHPKAIIEDLRKQSRGEAPAQADLFDDFNGIAFEDLVDFYQHEQHWSNRMILGDSLEVMTSLAEREGLKSQVQMIYMDPPYGVKFGSNWQVSTRERDVRDGRAEDSTRQPEQVRAFRDTWQLGIHSYLSYLRDRLVTAKSLLRPTGSAFVQIGDANVHLVRTVMDEVFGSENFVAQIAFKKTGGQSSDRLPGVIDYILWYARHRDLATNHKLFFRKSPGDEGATQYNWIELPDGTRRPLKGNETPTGIPAGSRIFQPYPLVSIGPSARDRPFEWEGQIYRPSPNRHWSVPSGLPMLARAGRLLGIGKTLRFVNYLDDYPVTPRTNVWMDTQTSGFAGDRWYVVQTLPAVIERCILMASDPGDLVLDPTCGGGTTALVSEEWGRRWITIDTSRVALTLARQRLMAARFSYYRLDDSRGADLRHGFVYKTVPHVTLSAVAENVDISDGMTRPQIEAAIAKDAPQETLYDQPEVDKSVVRVTGPFTMKLLSPNLGTPQPPNDNAAPSFEASSDFVAWIIDNLRAAGVQNTVRKERLTFDRLEAWPGRCIHASGEYSEDGKARRAAVTIGPQYGTIDADLVRDAAKEAAGFFDILVVCGFAFDAYLANEFRQLGNLTILKANMNPDLSMRGDLLKKTGSGNLFTVFGEPDIVINRDNGRVEVEIRGLDVYDPTTGQIRSHTTADIACWFIDTAYDGNSFFVRHAYFTGAGDPYKTLKAALRADIDEDAWASFYSTVSCPFDMPVSGRVAVKVINHYGDEVMKVYEMAEAKMVQLPRPRYEGRTSPAELMVADEEPDQG